MKVRDGNLLGVIDGLRLTSLHLHCAVGTGAHHLDLFFETPEDPPCASIARNAEEAVSTNCDC